MKCLCSFPLSGYFKFFKIHFCTFYIQYLFKANRINNVLVSKIFKLTLFDTQMNFNAQCYLICIMYMCNIPFSKKVMYKISYAVFTLLCNTLAASIKK